MRFTTHHVFLATAFVAVFASGWRIGLSVRPLAQEPEVISNAPAKPIGWAIPLERDFDAVTFEADIETLLQDADYATAVALLVQADVCKLIARNPRRFFKIDLCAEMPGTDIEFDARRDWVIPLGPDHSVWYFYAISFAEGYNRRVQETWKN